LIEVSEGPDLALVRTTRDPGSHELGVDVQFLERLLSWDESIAERVRAAGCPWCAGRLDSAHYARKPRFGDACTVADPEWSRRLSLCCARDGCRRRVTPPSVRFLGRRVYAEFVVLAACVRALALAQVHHERASRAVARRTVKRWLSWWRTAFVASALWQQLRSRLMPPVDEMRLPASLVQRLSAPASLFDAARLLSPLTTSSLPDCSRFVGFVM
jgi:hypothetical protein